MEKNHVVKLVDVKTRYDYVVNFNSNGIFMCKIYTLS